MHKRIDYSFSDRLAWIRWAVYATAAVVDGGGPSRLPVLIIRVYNSGVEGVLGSGGFDAEEIHGGVSSG